MNDKVKWICKRNFPAQWFIGVCALHSWSDISKARKEYELQANNPNLTLLIQVKLNTVQLSVAFKNQAYT